MVQHWGACGSVQGSRAAGGPQAAGSARETAAVKLSRPCSLRSLLCPSSLHCSAHAAPCMPTQVVVRVRPALTGNERQRASVIDYDAARCV